MSKETIKVEYQPAEDSEENFINYMEACVLRSGIDPEGAPSLMWKVWEKLQLPFPEDCK